MNRYGVTVREIQEELGLESPQAVYKWLNGKAIPSTENLLILSRLLNVPMEDMIVLEQDAQDTERKKEWDEKHPTVFMAFKMRVEEPIRESDSRRFSCVFEELVQERKRVAYCSDGV